MGMNLYNALPFIAASINVYAGVVYIKSMFSGGTRPNRVSWLIWFVGPFVVLVNQLRGGFELSQIFTITTTFLPLLILILSFLIKNAEWKITRFDIMCGGIALFALLLYIVNINPIISIGLAILSDFIGSIPTLLKAYKHPETESWTAFALIIPAAILTIISIQSFTFSNLAFALYILLINSALTFVALPKSTNITFGVAQK
jgi:hypothetical protein